MELTDSIYRVVWVGSGGNLMLLDYGDPLWSLPRLDGGQVIDPVAFVRASAIKVFPRGNESHTLSYEVAWIDSTIYHAEARALDGVLALPRTSGTLRWGLADGRGWSLSHAAIDAWETGTEERIARVRFSVRGGKLAATSAPASATKWNTTVY